ncbi:Glycosyltransferase [Quillaja saponaria]|uniref:Glycosyltransferase n=1 Tax=Quillaja saponaria TaxID=32244 RepID=A0AAD7P987_QUISA|nr:Glycosyltransferase [Quillaja saponaria]
MPHFFQKHIPTLPNNIKAYNVEDGVPANHVFSGNNPLEEVDLFLMAAPENFQKVLDNVVEETGRRIRCLITDGFLTFAAQIAEQMQIPWIPIWIPLPCTLSAHLYTDLIRELINFNSNRIENNYNVNDLNDQTLEIIPGLSVMRIADSPEEVLSGETFFSKTLSRIGQVFPKASVVVMNFYEELNPSLLNNDLKRKLPNLLFVGFLTISIPQLSLPQSDLDTTGCLSWLDKQKPMSVAYLSFGTVATPPLDELIQLAEALETSEIPFIWSLRDNLKNNLPNGFLGRIAMKGKVVSWAPQAEVLAHDSIGVFVTHCGCNSVYESIANAVPMICRPFFGDHWMTGRMVEEVWGIGVRICGGAFTKSGLVKSLEIVLVHEQGKIMRQKAHVLKEVVVKAAGPNGIARRDFKNLLQVIS